MEKLFKQISNGEKIAYLDLGKGKETLVLIHGNMSSGVHYKPIIERFQDDYHIIAPDLRGFGDSSYINRFDDLEDLAADVIELLDILGIHDYIVAGWSTGGAVAMSMALKRPKEVKKMILIESCSYRGYPVFKKNEMGQPVIGSFYTSKEELALDPVQVAPMENIFKTGATIYMKAVWDQVIYTVNKPEKADDDLYLSETMKERCLVDVDWALTRFNLSNFTNGVTEGNANIKGIICPVISFWGEKDIVVLEYMIDETVAALNNCKKVKLQNSGHSPLVDVPDKLAEEIRKFIR